MKNMIKRFFKEEEGVTMVEYCLIAALVSIVAIALITQVGTEVKDVWQKVQTALATATP